MLHGLQRLRVALGIGRRGDELRRQAEGGGLLQPRPDAQRLRAQVSLHDGRRASTIASGIRRSSAGSVAASDSSDSCGRCRAIQA